MSSPDWDYWKLRPNAPTSGSVLGPATEIPADGAREYRFGRGRSAFSMFVVRSEEGLHGYLNICPHYSMSLNHERDEFVSHGQIQCVQHFALFRRDDGLCVDGACIDNYLSPIPLYEGEDGIVRIGTPGHSA